MRQTFKVEAASVGFTMGFAYAMQAIAPHEQQELECQMAQDEQLMGVLSQHELFRRQWKKGYYACHIQQMAYDFLESKFPDQALVHIKNWQQGNSGYDPWVCEFVRGDLVSRQGISCRVVVRWISEVEGNPVNWWMISSWEGKGSRTTLSGEELKESYENELGQRDLHHLI